MDRVLRVGSVPSPGRRPAGEGCAALDAGDTAPHVLRRKAEYGLVPETFIGKAQGEAKGRRSPKSRTPRRGKRSHETAKPTV